MLDPMEMPLVDAVQMVVDATLEGVRICLPGQVESYDPKTRKANIKPMLKRVYADGEIQSLPVLTAVPVVWPAGAGGGLAFPLTRGDGVLILFSERNMENYLESGVESKPVDGRKFAMSDAIAIPGLYSFKAPSPFKDNTSARFTFGGATVRLQKGGKMAIGNAQAELLDIVSQTLQLLATTANTPAAPGSPLNPAMATQATALKTKLDNLLKGTL